MEKVATKRKRGWFWLGVTLLFFSLLWWVLTVLMIVSEGEEPVFAIGLGLFCTAIPIGLGITCLMQRSPSLERSPWGSGTLWAVSILGSFGVGGIIAGLNWRRMGKHSLMWPTMIVPIVAYFVWLLLPWPESEAAAESLSTLFSAGFAWSVWRWQKDDYYNWKELHPETARAGWQIPVLLIVVVSALFMGLLLV